MLQNPKEVKDNIVKWIKDYFDNTAKNAKVVIGISGGKDSYVVAALCKEALGVDRVVGILLPNGEQADINDSLEIATSLGIEYHIINIRKMYDAMVEQLNLTCSEISTQTMVNIAPRLRMTSLYAFAASIKEGARVVNTCNRSEDYIGYSTKYGDAAGDFSPLQELLVSEVRQVGNELGLLDKYINKAPSDGLCGKTDEDNLGFTYAELEEYICKGTSGSEEKDKIIKYKHIANLHKLELMPHFSL